MPLVDRPSFNTPSPVGQNILPPTPQAPPPQMDLTQAQPPAPGPSNSEDSHVSFDAPIPGQSLTDNPGNAPWEHPPQYTNPKEALDKVWENLTKPTNARQVIAMLYNGIPVEAIARTVLFAGFQNGKWTPDVALLIAKPVTYMIAAIGSRAGLDDKMKIKMPNNEPDPIATLAEAKVKDTPKDPKAATRGKDFIEGFLPRRSK